MTMSGKIIHEFEEVSSINGNDYFIATVMDRYSSNIFNQRKLNSLSVMQRLVPTVVDECGFGSMMSQEISDYSAVEHYHQESSSELDNNVERFNNITITRQLHKNTDFDVVKIGNCVINGDVYPQYISCETYMVDEYCKDEVGDIKFSMHDTKKTININSVEFDGWVYADGKKYNKNDFPEAYRLFSGTGNVFNVPEIKWFLKLKSSDGMKTDYESQKLVIATHSHGIRGSITGTATITLSVIVGRYGNGGPLFHGTYKEPKPPIKDKLTDIEIKTNINVEVPINDINININDKEQSGDIYPNHNYCPLMIYIGKKGNT